jgi:hypothetical protein
MNIFYRSTEKALRREHNQALLRALYGNAEDVAAVVKVIDSAPEWAEEVACMLAKAGVSVVDMKYAVMAVNRILERNPGVEPLGAAEFVATAAAVTGAHAEQMVLLDRPFHIARRDWP